MSADAASFSSELELGCCFQILFRDENPRLRLTSLAASRNIRGSAWFYGRFARCCDLALHRWPASAQIFPGLAHIILRLIMESVRLVLTVFCFLLHIYLVLRPFQIIKSLAF